MILGTREVNSEDVGALLISKNLLDKLSAQEFDRLAKTENISLIYYLVKHKILNAANIAKSLATHFDVPFVDLDSLDITSLPFHLLTPQLICEHTVVPLYYRGNTLFLLTDNPGKHSSFKEIQFHTGMIINILVSESDKLNQLINELFTTHMSPIKNLLIDFNSFKSAETKNQINTPASILNRNEVPLVQFIDQILHQAINIGASDIHFEPYELEYRIRYRKDGVLYVISKPPLKMALQITARIKVLANLDSSERRVPQDGNFQIKRNTSKTIEFRVNTCPTSYGEKIVLRLLNPEIAQLDIETLGFNEPQKKDFINALNKPQGMILVTGPTGSGKTVSLYTALDSLNNASVNISTAEDPVEIKMTGINQVPIDPENGLSCATILRAFLRQDPDIIMIGEIRDYETAELAINAAQTGHLVLSTLHTNSAAETLSRLLNMGITSFNIASSLTLIVAQRLARKLCTYCKTTRYDYTTEHLIELGFLQTELADLKLFKASGCNHCINGYNGRIGLFEVMPITRKLSQLIMNSSSTLEISDAATQSGMLTMYQSGLEKIREGITTIEEVLRVTVD
ncbi:MAG TPA: type IV-A pilus assembly ATPase PilB [Legionella sp.]|nr:type IV-A pilus assembly ATPase PilB [Legionella sp.]